jgi:hypothetical protein
MSELRAALHDLLAGLPEAIRRAVDVERTLRLEKKLAWQVFRLSRSTGLEEVGNVPSLVSASRLVAAARERGASDEVLNRVSNAFERFESFAVEQCGDRAGLVSLISGLTHERSESFELRERRSLFRSNAHVWGLQARAQLRTFIYKPSAPREGLYRTVAVSGNVGLQGLRRGEPMSISSWFSMTPGTTPTGAEVGTAAAAAGNAEFELLKEFCSDPLPEQREVVTENGMVEVEMVIPPAGRSGAVTVYSTQTTPSPGDPHRVNPFAGMFISVPTAEIVTDLLIPAGATDPTTARVSVFGRRHHPEQVFRERRQDLLPQRERVVHYGPNDVVPAIESSPQHGAAVHEVMRRHGLHGLPFDLYRCRVLYPVLHSLIVVRINSMAASPGGA